MELATLDIPATTIPGADWQMEREIETAIGRAWASMVQRMTASAGEMVDEGLITLCRLSFGIRLEVCWRNVVGSVLYLGTS